jgi:hypothetical protein
MVVSVLMAVLKDVRMKELSRGFDWNSNVHNTNSHYGDGMQEAKLIDQN